MKSKDVITILTSKIDPQLATDLVNEFMNIRVDTVTGTLGKSSVGKFVESIVQALQFLDIGKFENKPNIDEYLKTLESQQANLHDGLKICVARVARGMYTFRNKRNILHKGDVDPNIYDQRWCYSSAQWILTELVRSVTSSTMQEAGKLVAFIQLPVEAMVEDFDTRKIVFGDLSTEEEALVLLHSYYPENASFSQVRGSMDRRAQSSVSSVMKRLWNKKLLNKNAEGLYKLTQQGFQEAQIVIKAHSANN